jgi:hypothetical protein
MTLESPGPDSLERLDRATIPQLQGAAKISRWHHSPAVGKTFLATPRPLSCSRSIVNAAPKKIRTSRSSSRAFRELHDSADRADAVSFP